MGVYIYPPQKGRALKGKDGLYRSIIAQRSYFDTGEQE